MEQETRTIGNFADFRASLIEDYKKAKQQWIDQNNDPREMDEIEAEIHLLECRHVEKQLGKVLLPLGVKIYNGILTSQRAWKEAELARLEVLRKEGMSYSERMQKINPERLQRVLAVDKGDITLNDIELKPIEQWLEPITGYDRLKEVGVTEFVTRNFSFMFNIKK